MRLIQRDVYEQSIKWIHTLEKRRYGIPLRNTVTEYRYGIPLRNTAQNSFSEGNFEKEQNACRDCEGEKLF